MAELLMIVGLPLATALMGFTFVLTMGAATPDVTAEARGGEGKR